MSRVREEVKEATEKLDELEYLLWIQGRELDRAREAQRRLKLQELERENSPARVAPRQIRGFMDLTTSQLQMTTVALGAGRGRAEGERRRSLTLSGELELEQQSKELQQLRLEKGTQARLRMGQLLERGRLKDLGDTKELAAVAAQPRPRPSVAACARSWRCPGRMWPSRAWGSSTAAEP